MVSRLSTESVVKAVCDSDCSEDGSGLLTDSTNESFDDDCGSFDERKTFLDGNVEQDLGEQLLPQQNTRRNTTEPSRVQRSESLEHSNKSSSSGSSMEDDDQSVISDVSLPRTRTTRKRKRQEEKWKKVLRKRRRNSGKKYISSVKKLVRLTYILQ